MGVVTGHGDRQGYAMVLSLSVIGVLPFLWFSQQPLDDSQICIQAHTERITSISATDHIGHNHIGHIEDHIGHRQSRYRPQVDSATRYRPQTFSNKILPLLLNERNFLIRVLYKDCYWIL